MERNVGRSRFNKIGVSGAGSHSKKKKHESVVTAATEIAQVEIEGGARSCSPKADAKTTTALEARSTALPDHLAGIASPCRRRSATGSKPKPPLSHIDEDEIQIESEGAEPSVPSGTNSEAICQIVERAESVPARQDQPEHEKAQQEQKQLNRVHQHHQQLPTQPSGQLLSQAQRAGTSPKITEPWARSEEAAPSWETRSRSNYRDALKARGIALMKRASLWKQHVSATAEPSIPAGVDDCVIAPRTYNTQAPPAAQALGLCWTPTAEGLPAGFGSNGKFHMDLASFVSPGPLSTSPPQPQLPQAAMFSSALSTAPPAVFSPASTLAPCATTLSDGMQHVFVPEERQLQPSESLLASATDFSFVGLNSAEIAERLSAAAPCSYDD